MALWRAPHATVMMDKTSEVNSGTTIIGQSGSLASYMSGATVVTGSMKNVTVVVPEGEVEMTNFLGVTSSFQNADLDKKPFGMAELSGTFVLTHDELLMDSQSTPEHLFFGLGDTTPTGYHQYQAGLITSGDYNRPAITIVVKIADASDEVTMALENAHITKYGDVKIDGADGVWEFEISAKALPKDFAMEWKD